MKKTGHVRAHCRVRATGTFTHDMLLTEMKNTKLSHNKLSDNKKENNPF